LSFLHPPVGRDFLAQVQCGFHGAAIKNIGVGKRGKMNLHGALAGNKPVIKPELCPGRKCEWWQTCEDCCPEGSIKVTEKRLEINLDSCVYCFAWGINWGRVHISLSHDS
jgi:uncharacterized Fe-S center protein